MNNIWLKKNKSINSVTESLEKRDSISLNPEVDLAAELMKEVCGRVFTDCSKLQSYVDFQARQYSKFLIIYDVEYGLDGVYISGITVN